MTVQGNQRDVYTSYSPSLDPAIYQLTFMKWSKPTTDWIVLQVSARYTNSQRFVSKLMLNDVQALFCPQSIAQWPRDEEADVDWIVGSRMFAPATVNRWVSARKT